MSCREASCGQRDHHEVLNIGNDNAVQGTIRIYPDAFLATSVLVCEGATEVGFVRGLDQYFEGQGRVPIAAHGVAFIDAGGGGPNDAYNRATPMRSTIRDGTFLFARVNISLS